MDTYRQQQPTFQFSFGGPMTRVVKWLIIVNVAVMVLLFIADAFLPGAAKRVLGVFALHSREALLGGRVWQFATYAFLHSAYPMHILVNMLMLWMFGRDVERYLGPKKFLWVYLGCGVAGGVCFSIFQIILGGTLPCVGASGAVIGILAIYALYYPNRQVMIFFIFPLKVKYLAMILIGLNVWNAAASAAGKIGDDVAYFAHLGGAAFAFLFVRLGPTARAYVGAIERQRDVRKVESEEQVRARVDELLEKISQNGIAALTRKERTFLKNASKNYQKPRQKTPL